MSKSSGEDALFSESEKERIRAAVAAAEAETSGEIATMVVDRSDSYLEAEVLGTLLLAGLLSLVVCLTSGHVSIWSYIPSVFLLIIPARLAIRRFPALQRPFISRRRLEETVRERALRVFYEKGLYRTRDETGVLIFMSLFERKVWILGDRGINSRIAPGYWGGLAGLLTRGIREGRGCEALCELIGNCGRELARHFPRKDDDANELSDEVIE